MNMLEWIDKAKTMSYAALSKASQALGAGVGFVRATVGGVWLLGSTESSSEYDQAVDEKHYFLLPDRRAELGYSLYVMRWLPEGVPPLNDLPKRRVVHLPNEHAWPTLERIVTTDARRLAAEGRPEEDAWGARLNAIANNIDKLDDKVFNGVLLIGGLVALVNPVAGAAVALKAMAPSVGMLLSKYGLKLAGETATKREMQARINKAEREVLAQFQDAATSSIVNPLLAQFDRALATTAEQYEPIAEFDEAALDFGARDQRRLLTLTCQALTNLYREIRADRRQWAPAQLGPEDLRFLELIEALAQRGP